MLRSLTLSRGATVLPSKRAHVTRVLRGQFELHVAELTALLTQRGGKMGRHNSGFCPSRD